MTATLIQSPDRGALEIRMPLAPHESYKKLLVGLKR
jgi:hypothetical protein